MPLLLLLELDCIFSYPIESPTYPTAQYVVSISNSYWKLADFKLFQRKKRTVIHSRINNFIDRNPFLRDRSLP